MASDPRKLRPSELCRLLNSTPLDDPIGSVKAWDSTAAIRDGWEELSDAGGAVPTWLSIR